MSEAPDPIAAVVRMIRGHWISFCVRAAAELGVLDALVEPLSVDQLARTCACDPRALARLLRTLDDLGLVQPNAEGIYAITPLGETLQTGHPSALRDLALMHTAVPNLVSWHSLAEAVRSGDGVFERVNGFTQWEYLADNPHEQVIFDAAMARRGVHQAAAIRAGCDISAVSTLVDVGGGKGGMVTALLADEPHLSAIVADRPDVAAAAEDAFATAGIDERARAVAADFFESVPAGRDAYVLSNVLHDWADAEAVAILRTVRTAMTPGARLWILEQVLDAPGRTAEQTRDLHLVDLHMLVLFGSGERTKEEYDTLLQDAGFSAGTLLAADCAWNVIEARL
jgi:DNA-binding HxlR family transcriptional regulator